MTSIEARICVGRAALLALALVAAWPAIDGIAQAKAGHSRRAHELPRWLGALHRRFHSPHRVLLVLTIVAIALVNFVPLRELLPVASACTLVWYAATNFAAPKLGGRQRFLWPLVSWLGIATCMALFLSLPLWSIASAAGLLAILGGIR